MRRRAELGRGRVLQDRHPDREIPGRRPIPLPEAGGARTAVGDEVSKATPGGPPPGGERRGRMIGGDVERRDAEIARAGLLMVRLRVADIRDELTRHREAIARYATTEDLEDLGQEIADLGE